ncbi:ThiF family adenylyltransferase [Promicromonospora thailandica]|uniref:ThiF family protein n=1 Tax=Promicromonospora thailandica TaxID=765201 RepID=A0A9X2G3U1_9MICO|nr:ThiF family adenylyltransferase [Promicromonospora thailandica]MCP2264988.1 ThiF family protein [Promicromonospora thailandica]
MTRAPLLRLRPGTPVLSRGGGQVQCGSDPRWSFVLSGLTAAEETWLGEVAERRHVTVEQAAARCGVPAERRDEIMTALFRAGVLVPVPRSVGAVTAPADGAADATVLGMLRPDGAGLATLADRARRTVGVVGLGRVGTGIAQQLATAGVGRLVLHDPLPAQVTDLAAGGLRSGDVGRARHDAVRSLLAERAPRMTVRVDDDVAGPDPAELDVVVVTEPHAAHPARYRRLLGLGVPHLPVVVREADMVVGPFVRPGLSACVTCVDLARADADREWPALATQLRTAAEPTHEATLAAVAAATAAGQVLAQLDGHRPAAVGACLEIALPAGLPRARPADPHPRCGCVVLPADGAGTGIT